MKHAILALAVLLTFNFRSSAELFSSSTNFIQTLTVDSNQVIFISSVVYSPTSESCRANILVNGQSHEVPFAFAHPAYGERVMQNVSALSGPMQIQFQHQDVHIEIRRALLTNLISRFVNSNSLTTVVVPVGQTIHIMKLSSWGNATDFPQPQAKVTISNATATVENDTGGDISFTGPVTITMRPLGPEGTALFTYYFTEEFSTIPAVGAIQVPAGQAQIQVERSEDMQNWRTVFFNQTPADARGFYRLKASK